MSFICDNCKQPTAPGVKPTFRVTATRPVQYNCNVRVEDDGEGKRAYERQIRHGNEIVHEERICPTCANLPESKVQELDLAPFRTFVDGMAKTHLRGCKRDVRDCHTCTNFVERVASFPLHALAYALAEGNSMPTKKRKVNVARTA